MDDNPSGAAASDAATDADAVASAAKAAKRARRGSVDDAAVMADAAAARGGAGVAAAATDAAAAAEVARLQAQLEEAQRAEAAAVHGREVAERKEAAAEEARMAAERDVAAAVAGQEVAERNAAAAEEARIAAERHTAAAIEAREAAEGWQLLVVAATLTTVGWTAREVHGRHLPAGGPTIPYGTDSSWDPLTDGLFATFLRRLRPGLVDATTAHLPRLAAELLVPGRTVQHVLDTLEVGLGVVGTWANNVVVGLVADDTPLVTDHGWLLYDSAAPRVPTLTLESAHALPVACMRAQQLGAARLLRSWRAAPAMPCVYALGTDSDNLGVVRLSVQPRGVGEGRYVLVQRSVALPLWASTGGRTFNGLPPGMAVLLALMLAQGDELLEMPAAAGGAGGHGV